MPLASSPAPVLPEPVPGASGKRLPVLPSSRSLSAEFQLLAASSWDAPQPLVEFQAGRIAAAYTQGVNWEQFLRLIVRHRLLVEPETLDRALGDRLPAGVREELRKQKRHACRESLGQAAELVRINEAFRRRRIDLLPIKGVLLSAQLYGDPGRRVSRDFDLLVRPEHLTMAEQVLQELGYQLTQPDCPLTPRRRRWLVGQMHHFGYTDSAQHLVELHWRVLLWKPEEMAWLWQESRPARLLGSEFRVLSDVALLLLLCDHGAKHSWSRLKWLNDLMGFVAQRPPVDWPPMVARARQFDLARSVAQAGLLLNWVHGWQLPEPWADLVRLERTAVPLAQDALEAMYLEEGAQFRLPVRLQRTVHPLRIRRRLGTVQWAQACLISTDSFRELPLPDWLFWLYFPLRPALWCYHHYVRPLLRRT
jgi:hypothetical protein